MAKAWGLLLLFTLWLGSDAVPAVPAWLAKQADISAELVSGESNGPPAPLPVKRLRTLTVG